jgi:hypothetical protein
VTGWRVIMKIVACGALLVGGVLVWGLGGCSVSCTLAPRPSFDVSVVDSASGGPVDVPVTVVISDGVFRDSAHVGVGESQRMAILFERPGNYRVEVRAAGYASWIRDGLRVREDECHVQTLELVVRLQRS